MKYVDAGYAICLSVLFLYAVSLILRHRRLARAVAMAEVPPADGAHGAGAGPEPGGNGNARAWTEGGR